MRRRRVMAVVAMLAGLSPLGAIADPPAPMRCAVVPSETVRQARCEIGPGLDLPASMRGTWRKENRTGTVDATIVPFAPGGRAAVIVAVDRAEKLRAKTVALEAADAVRLAEAARATGTAVRVGLAAYGDRLDTPAGIGAARDEIQKAATAIKADGFAGDTAAHLRTLIATLAASGDTRRILVVSTDARAEEAAFAHAETIRQAQAGGVVIVGVLYREVAETPGIAGLRRLAAETGGTVLEAAPGQRLDEASIQRLATLMKSGGTLTFPLDAREPRGRYVVTAEFEGGGRLTTTLYADVDSLATAAPAATAEAHPAPPAPDEPGLAQSTGIDRALTVLRQAFLGNSILPRLVIAVLLGLAALAWFRRWQRQRSIRAYLQMDDDSAQRIPIRADGIRLGRHSDNDIRFSERSVHRHHAFLYREPESPRYIISDVSRDQSRSNGVVVNSEIVKKAPLAHGDLIELGEVRFRFLYAGKYAP